MYRYIVEQQERCIAIRTLIHLATFVAVAFVDFAIVAAVAGAIDYYRPTYRPKPYSNPDPTCLYCSEEPKREIKSVEHRQTIQ